MSQRWNLLPAVFALAALAAAAPSDAGERHFGRRGPPPIDRVLERHAERLGLAAEVQERVREIAAEAEREGAPLREELARERNALHALLAQDAPDADAVMRQAEAIGAAETAMHKQRLRTLLEVRALLTPAQRQELVKIFEEKRERMRSRHAGDGPPPAPEP